MNSKYYQLRAYEKNNLIASRIASLTKEQILSINEATVPKHTKMAAKFGLIVVNGKLINPFPNSKFTKMRAKKHRAVKISTPYVLINGNGVKAAVFHVLQAFSFSLFFSSLSFLPFVLQGRAATFCVYVCVLCVRKGQEGLYPCLTTESPQKSRNGSRNQKCRKKGQTGRCTLITNFQRL